MWRPEEFGHLQAAQCVGRRRWESDGVKAAEAPPTSDWASPNFDFFSPTLYTYMDPISLDSRHVLAHLKPLFSLQILTLLFTSIFNLIISFLHHKVSTPSDLKTRSDHVKVLLFGNRDNFDASDSLIQHLKVLKYHKYLPNINILSLFAGNLQWNTSNFSKSQREMCVWSLNLCGDVERDNEMHQQADWAVRPSTPRPNFLNVLWPWISSSLQSCRLLWIFLCLGFMATQKGLCCSRSDD